VTGYIKNINQRSTTYGTRATLGTPSNFQWHAGAQVLHITFVMIYTEDILTSTCLKNVRCWHTKWFETLIQHTISKRLPTPDKISRKVCKSFVPLVAFSALPTASSSLWLAVPEYYIREFIFKQFSNPDFVTNITLAPLLQWMAIECFRNDQIDYSNKDDLQQVWTYNKLKYWNATM